MDQMQNHYIEVRKKLDQLDYRQPLHIESTMLVKTMLRDLGDLTKAYQKTSREVSQSDIFCPHNSLV